MVEELLLPPHAYVPGRTPRHDPAFFASIHASVTTGMDAPRLSRTLAWRAGLNFLQKGYFWEAHEALEPVWVVTEPGSTERALVQGIIQVANAELKAVMGRPNAVLRLCDLAGADLEKAWGESAVDAFNVDLAALESRLERLRKAALRSKKAAK